MDVTVIISLLGGLALFLYGMNMMSSGLEEAAGHRLKNILEKLTSNRFLGVAVGAVITALIQSSSATTVMVVGFVNSRLMTLQQAVWIIMGANIGTTITGQLIALDIGALAPIIAFLGVVFIVFLKNKQLQHIGSIIAGLGILFIGMDMMSAAMTPLRELPAFVDLFTTFSHPLIGIAAGAIFTALIQSSSASVGILQALASSGAIGLGSAVYVLYGQNIGTCITAVLASVGTSRNAKRTTVIHLMFNLIGTVLFVALTMTTPFVSWMEQTSTSPMAQIANVHTVFNIVTTLLLLPFGQYMARLACRILPDLDEVESDEMQLKFIKDHNIGNTVVAISELSHEVERMFDIARENVRLAFDSVLTNSDANFQHITDNEEYIDFLNTEITRFISKLSADELAAQDTETVNRLFTITGNIERIGDHAMNIAEYIPMFLEKGLVLSKAAQKELMVLRDVVMPSLEEFDFSQDPVPGLLDRSAQMEQKVDDLSLSCRDNQINRMKRGEITAETCVIYSEMLTDIERISDHILNLAEATC